MPSLPAITPDPSRVTAHVSPVVPQVPSIMSRLGDIALPQIMTDLSAVPPHVADVLSAIAPVAAEVSPVAAELVPVAPGGLGLSGTQCGSADDQRQQREENGAVSHTSFLLKSWIRRTVARDVRRAVWNTRDA